MPLQQLALGRHLFALECQGRNACVPRVAVVFEQTGVQNTNSLITNAMARMTSTMTKPFRSNSTIGVNLDGTTNLGIMGSTGGRRISGKNGAKVVSDCRTFRLATHRAVGA